MNFKEATENIGEIVYGFYGGEGKLVGVKLPDRVGWFEILVQRDWGGQTWEPGQYWSLYHYDGAIIERRCDTLWPTYGF